MKQGLSNNIKILLTAVILCLLVFVGPSISKNILMYYLHRMTPARQVFVGDRLLCEDLKTRISSASGNEKTEILNSLLSILKLSVGEFRELVKAHDRQRKMLGFVMHEEIESVGGPLQSQSCLIGALGEFPTFMDLIIPALLESDILLNAVDSQMRISVFSLFTQACANNTSCAVPLKNYILKAKDLRSTAQYLNMLTMTGSTGVPALFDIWDSLPEAEKRPTQEDAELFFYTLNGMAIRDEKLKLAAYEEAQKRLDNPSYSEAKKEMLRRLPNPLTKTYRPPLSAAPVVSHSMQKPSEFIKAGQEMLARYAKSVPSDMIEFSSWQQNLSKTGFQEWTASEKTELTQVVDGFFVWILKYLGPQSNTMKQFLTTLGQVKTVVHPLRSAFAEVKNPENRLVAMAALSLAIPDSKEAIEVFGQNFSKLSPKDKSDLFRDIRYKLVKMEGESDFPYLLFSQLSDTEVWEERYMFKELASQLIYGWKSASAKQPRLKTDELTLFKLSTVTGDDLILKKLVEVIHAKPSCSDQRFQSLSHLIMNSIDNPSKTWIPVFKKHLLCYSENPKGTESLLGLLLHIPKDFRKLLRQELKKEPKLKGEFRTKVLKDLEEEVPVAPSPPMPEVGVEAE